MLTAGHCLRCCRLPLGEVLRPRVGDLLDLACNTLFVDNEENASICLKLAVELHRNFRSIMEHKAPVLLDFVKVVGSRYPPSLGLSAQVKRTLEGWVHGLAAPCECATTSQRKRLACMYKQVLFLLDSAPGILRTLQDIVRRIPVLWGWQGFYCQRLSSIL